MSMNLNFATKDSKSVVCDGKCDFPVHSDCPKRKSANKQIRTMTKINAASNTAKPFIRTWKL